MTDAQIATRCAIEAARTANTDAQARETPKEAQFPKSIQRQKQDTLEVLPHPPTPNSINLWPKFATNPATNFATNIAVNSATDRAAMDVSSLYGSPFSLLDDLLPSNLNLTLLWSTISQ